MNLLPGTLLGGRYRIEALLGSGGMGAIYSAVQEGLNRRVALKVLHTHLSREGDLLERFKREARAIAALGHPNVVQVNDFQTNPGEPPFMVMELLQGESLSAAIAREGQLSAERVAFIAMQVLSALAAAHNAGIVHRDIKPDNIFLSATSVQSDLVKVLDFGVAKVLRDEKDPKLTRSGHFLGTLSYTAPEQARGADIDARVDLYSLGACMYVALAGRKPFDAPTMPLLVGEILNVRPVSLAAIRTDLDVVLCDIVLRALEKNRDDRFANAEEMAAAIGPLASPTPAAGRSSQRIDPGSSRGSLAPTAREPAPAASPLTRRDGSTRAVATDPTDDSESSGGVLALVRGRAAPKPSSLLSQSGATEPPAPPRAQPTPMAPPDGRPMIQRATLRMMSPALAPPMPTLVSGKPSFHVPSLPPMAQAVGLSDPLSSRPLDGDFGAAESSADPATRRVSPLLLVLGIVAAVALVLVGATAVLFARRVAVTVAPPALSDAATNAPD